MVAESLSRVARFLGSQRVQVLIAEEAFRMLGDGEGGSATHEEMGTECDLIIAVGGDGNMLGTARSFAPYGVPIVGVNRGRLGFLADISPEDIESSLGQVLSGNYTVEEHFLLEGEVSVKGVTQVPCALNEVVLHSAETPHMIEFDMYLNDAFVYNQYSDGVIVATPTGSTAYSLSAGGPIMHPSLNAIVTVPMFPHTLNSRPLVVPGDSEIKIVVGSHVGINARVSFDSQVEFEIEPGQALIIRKMADKLRLIHPPGHSFFSVCRSKLDWASRVGE
ncbi:MAG TPA: NAD(+) kinase [Pseudomonadales bacterium]|nr:NAD(+) kinase [Pseudomonadales bacterium]